MLGAESPYLPGQNPTDADKAAAYGNVHVNFATEGLTDKGVMQPFQWKEIFGQDSNGKPSKAKIIFLQKDATTNAEINRFILEIDQAGKHTWTDQYGKPAKLPLYSTALEPYRYEVALDYQTSDKITFLTMEIGKSDSKATFKKDSDGKIVADIPLSITLGQVASTKFTSEWRTSVEEADRPPVEGLFDHDASNGDIADETGFFKFPKNDTGKTILRNDEKPIDEYNGFDEFYGNDLRTVPIVKVVEGFDLDTDSATYTLDEASKTITSLDGKKFKYDFAYDVINGGKLTMTEVIPVTFDANGGTFGPGAEQKVIQEVEYGQDASSVESPTPTEGKTFIGWGDRPDATNPVDQETAFKGITGAKTFYAIYTEDVIEQPGKDKPGNVPDGHVKITVQLTDKAEVKNDQGDLLTGEDYNKAITRIFWVNPDKQVTLPVAKPAGKTVPVSESNPTEYRWDFKNWTSDEKPSRAWTTDIDQGIKGQFEAAETLITANYDQVIIDNGDLVAGEITVPESFKTTDDAWMNNFVPKADDLKSLVQLKGTDGQVGQLPSDATFEFVLGKNSSGQPYGSLDEELYDKLKEKANPKDEPTRRETVQAEVTFKNGQVKEVAIPIQVVKNIYEAKTLTEKPYYVPDGYVKVTVNPTTKATDPQKTYFYVNPKAKVIIPEGDPTGKDDNVFLKWTQKADGSTNEPTDITIAGDVRNQFKVATTITAQYVVDVIPQKGDKKPGNVPDTFVEVTFLQGDHGTIANTEVSKYWVNPKKEVTLTAPAVAAKADYKHTGWDKALTQTFRAKTDITAQYKQKVLTTDPDDKDYVKVDFNAGNDGSIATDQTKEYWVLKDVEVTLAPPTVTPKTGKKIDTESPWSPVVQTIYTQNTTHTAQYAYDGADVVPQEGTDKPDVPANFVKVIVQLTDKAKVTDPQGDPLTGDDYTKAISKTFWVNPTEAVTIPVAKPTGKDVARDTANPIAFSWKFTGWQSDESPAREWKKDIDQGFTGKFTEKETTVTAQYVKDQADNGDLEAEPLKVAESFKDGEGNFVNDFIPSQTDLEEKLKLKGGNPIPNDGTVEFVLGTKSDGSKYTSFDEELYDKLQEKANPNDEPTRRETVQVKVTFKNGQEQTVDIPIVVYKNIYQAKTLTERPHYVPDSYKKVTLDPTTKAKDPQKTYYYVNPNAYITIPGANPTGVGDNKFTKWTVNRGVTQYKGTKVDANGSYDLSKRYKFAGETTIEANYVTDVIPQTGKDKPTDVPETFVKVTLVPTDKGTLEGPHVFWVNRDKAVTIPLGQLTPKKGWTLEQWTIGEPRENRKVIDLTKAHTFTEAETVITARYSYAPQAIKDLEPKKVPVHTPEGKTPSPEDYKTKITPPDGKTIASVKIVKDPDVTKPGDSTAKVIITYTDGSSIGSQDKPVDIQVKVHEKVIPAKPNGDKPEEALNNYVKVIFQAGTGGSLDGTLTYYVSPEVPVDMTEQAKAITKTPAVGYLAQSGESENWTNAENKTLQGTFTDEESIFIYNFVPNKDIIEKTPETPDQPAGYVTVTFRAGDKGQLAGPVDQAGQETAVGERVFYVNPKAGIKLKVLEEGEQAGEKELAVPTPLAKDNYGFDKWVEDLDLTNPITGNREYVAHFKLGQVTLTYAAGEGSGTPPDQVTAKHGATVQLANAPRLSKVNSVFAGWKLDGEDKLYQAGESIVLDRDRTATAQWTLDKDVIPQEGTDKPENVPDNFVSVTFVPTDKGTLEGPRVFWVNPDKAVTIPVQTPVGTQHYTFKEWKLGAEAYQPLTPKQFKEDTTVTATYVEAADIIPYAPDEPITKPEGYVRVSFAAQPGLSLENVQHYYVKKGAGVTLGHADLVKPGVQASTGYVFKDWDTADTTPVDQDMIVTALAQALPDVQEKTEDQPDKPDPAYVTVTFTEDNSGSGQVTDKVYYVNPDKYVRLMPPTGADIQPSVGYVFGAWSQDARQATNYSKDTIITASFNKIGDVIPKKDGTQKPDGYVTVSFKITGGGGEIKAGEMTAYYVNPAATVSLEAPAVSAATGHAFDTWTPNPAAARQYAEDTTIIGTFAGYPDIVPGKDESGQPNVKPEAYVTVTFVTGSLGQLEGETVYYVNPDAGKVLGDLTKPTIKAKSGVKANGWNRKDSLAIVEDLIVVAEYDFIQEKPQPGGGSGGSSGWIIPSPKPDKPTVKPSESDLNKADHYQYLIGYPDGTFAPNRGMTRAEVATMFTRLLKDRPIKWKKYDAGFSDVKQGDWYANTVGYAVQKGIVAGYPDGSFRPNKPITRAEFSAIAARFAALTDEKDITFIDLAADHWGYKAIRLAASHGWISGYPDDTFRPEQAITRAEVTSITNRMLNRHGDLAWIDSHSDLIIHFADVARTDWYYEPIMEATMGHDFTRDPDGKHEHWTGINWKSFI
ncbi:S-layer homology domain-containing protein [Peptococcus simiae]|uniref:S-layer homology domain-containing protein n=1 Tax=Peptococcus simiae TaxID=1643805 RepID=UPI00397FEA07